MKVRLQWTYEIPKTKRKVTMQSALLETSECIELLNDLEKTGRLNEVTIFDENDTAWTKKQWLRHLERKETEPHEVTAYVDGNFDRASKRAGIGIVIYYKKDGATWRVRLNDEFDYLHDNNEAEFAALYRLLLELEQLGVRAQKLTVFVDSLTVQKQAAGEWPCYEKNYAYWLDKVDAIADKLHLTIAYELIERNDNKEADRLASQALRGTLIESTTERP